jgi:hypothetical protein
MVEPQFEHQCKKTRSLLLHGSSWFDRLHLGAAASANKLEHGYVRNIKVQKFAIFQTSISEFARILVDDCNSLEMRSRIRQMQKLASLHE